MDKSLTPDPEVERVEACPFCGYPGAWEGKGQWRIVCTNVTCGAMGPTSNHRTPALIGWNERAALPRATPSRERIARLLCEQHGGDPDSVATEEHDCWEGPLWTAFTAEADAVLSLLPASRDGWRLVPEEATDTMLIAGRKAFWHGAMGENAPSAMHATWSAMLEAAPLPEPPSLAAAPEEG